MNPRTHVENQETKKLSTVAHVCDPSAGRQRREGSGLMRDLASRRTSQTCVRIYTQTQAHKHNSKHAPHPTCISLTETEKSHPGSLLALMHLPPAPPTAPRSAGFPHNPFLHYSFSEVQPSGSQRKLCCQGVSRSCAIPSPAS